MQTNHYQLSLGYGEVLLLGEEEAIFESNQNFLSTIPQPLLMLREKVKK